MIALPDQIVFQPHHAELVYDDKTHTYRLRSGEVLSSVTGILKAEGIQQYGPRNSASDFAMQVGTWVHQAVEWFEKGTLDESALSPGIALYLESYKKFRNATGFRPFLDLIEVPMWQPQWRFCGTPDLPGMIGNRFVLGDLKTGGKRAGDTVQIAAYGELVMSSVVGFDRVYPEGKVIYLQEDGSQAKVENVSADQMFRHKSIFISTLQINRWKAANGANRE